VYPIATTSASFVAVVDNFTAKALTDKEAYMFNRKKVGSM